MKSTKGNYTPTILHSRSLNGGPVRIDIFALGAIQITTNTGGRYDRKFAKVPDAIFQKYLCLKLRIRRAITLCQS